MMKRYIFLLAILLLFIGHLLAQNITPPESASFGRFLDIPVSPYTGVPNISIPIYTVKEGPLQLPISLSYHAAGHKVADLASNVGLGWELFTGGGIYRAVKGRSDDVEGGYFYNNGLTPSIEDLANGEADGEADIFSFSFPGYQGHFVLNNYGDMEDITTIPSSDLKIKIESIDEVDGHTFKTISITTPNDGTIYRFGAAADYVPNQTEQQLGKEFIIIDGPDFRNGYVSSWKLVQVVTHDGKNSIDLFYKSIAYNYFSPAYCTLNIKKDKDSGEQSPANQSCNNLYNLNNYWYQEISVTGNIISKIKTRTCEINFLHFDRQDLTFVSSPLFTGQGINEVIVKEGSSSDHHFKYVFDQNYFLSTTNSHEDFGKRLKLSGMHRESLNGQDQEPPYTFLYHETAKMPHRLSHQIDHWGYYNGAVGNENYNDIIPNFSIPVLPDHPNGGSVVNYLNNNINRNPSEYHTKLWVLKNMTYPTGGAAEYIYEINKGIDKNDQSAEEIVTVAAGDSIECHSFYDDLQSKVETLTAEDINAGFFQISITSDAADDCPNQDVYAFLTFIQGGNLIDIPSFNSTEPAAGEVMRLSTLGLMPGSVTIQLRTTMGEGKVRLYKIPPAYVNIPIGGLRIKETQIKESSLALPIIKKYKYQKDFSDGISLDLSSAVYVGRPNYGHDMSSYTEDCYQVLAESFSSAPLSAFEGYHVGYERVEEELDGHGWNVYEYFTEDFSHVPQTTYPATTIQPRIISGSLKKSTEYNIGKVVVSSVEYKMVQDSYEEIDEYTFGLKIDNQCGSSFTRSFPHSLRNRNPFRPANVTNFKDGLTTTTTYEYDWAHLQPSVSRTIDSEGKEVSQRIWYTQNYGNEPDVKQHFIDRHIITVPFINMTFVKQSPDDPDPGEFIKGSQVHFGLFDANGNPNSVDPNNIDPCSSCDPYPLANYVFEKTFPSSSEDKWHYVSFYDKYDPIFGFVKQTHARGWEDQPTIYEYNTEGMMTSKKTMNGDFEMNYTYYDGSMLLESSEDQTENIKTVYTYDGLTRLQKKENYCSGSMNTTLDYLYRYHDQLDQNPQGQNFIRTTSTYPDVGDATLDALSDLSTLVNYSYTDGLGRTIQTVAQNHGPNENEDIISHVTYNEWSQVDKKYEPFTVANNGGKLVSNIPSTVKFTSNVYYDEPAGRIKMSTPPDWHPTEYEYGVNTSIDNVEFRPGTIVGYDPGELFRNQVKDSNGNISIAFTDKRGRTVLKRRTDSNGANAIDTYYGYDEKDRLEYAFPPGTSLTSLNSVYTYHYDNRDQLIEKKVPQKVFMTYRYSNRGLLTFTQDGYLRANGNKWYAYDYDEYGRELHSGIVANGHLSGTWNQGPEKNILAADQLTENTYGNINTRDERRLISSRTKVLDGGISWLTSSSVYDDCGRVIQSTGNNHLNNSSTAETITMAYDWADNVLTDTRTHNAFGQTQIILNTGEIDFAGRLKKAKFKFNNDPELILNKPTYDHKNRIMKSQIGSSNGGSSYLETMDYTYLENNILKSSSCNLFSETLYYDQISGVAGVTTHAQLNGNIGAVVSQISGQNAHTFAYTYDYLDRMTDGDYYGGVSGSQDDYNVHIEYDERGNITDLDRYGEVNGSAQQLIDQLAYTYQANNNNLLEKVTDKVTDGTNKASGYNPKTNANYEYDTYGNGNVRYDPSRDVTFTYNHLDLPVSADFGDQKTIEWLYDAGGGLLRKTVNQDNSPIDTRDYVGGIEYKNQIIDVVYHGEGRVVNKASGSSGTINLSGTTSATQVYAAEMINSTQVIESTADIEYKASSMIFLNAGFETQPGAEFYGHIEGVGSTGWEYQYTISDHLGNTRVVYADIDGNGTIDPATEIIQANDYYPFGLKMDNESDGIRDTEAYQYNGIEYVEDHGLDYNMATYRCLDPSIGRWLSVDPQAESSMSLSPYNSMNNNPISNVDPNGDNPFAIGAAIGFLSNGIGNVLSGQNFFKGWAQATFFGAVGGGISSGIGGVASNISNGFARAGFQAAAHGLSGGLLSAAQGGNFGSGALSGAVSSGIGSGIGASGLQGSALDWAQWGGGGLGGGLGSVIGGGNFFDGVRQGLITGGLNHAGNHVNNMFSRPNDIIYLLDKQGAIPGIAGHSALLIQGPDGKWYFVSKTGQNTNGVANVDVGSPSGYNSPQEFYNSAEGKRYETRVRFQTSKDQDMAAMAAVNKSAGSKYKFLSNNCMHLCRTGLNAAGLYSGTSINPIGAWHQIYNHYGDQGRLYKYKN